MRFTRIVLLSLSVFCAHADVMVTGDIDNMPLNIDIGKAQTLELRAYSKQGNAVNGQTNAFTINSTLPIGMNTTQIPVVNPNPAVAISVPQKKGKKAIDYSPSVQVKTKKPAAPISYETITSATPNPQNAKWLAVGLAFESLSNPASPMIGTSAYVIPPKKVVGQGAGGAYDPVTLEPALYFNYQYSIDASFQIDPASTEGLVFFAVDSRLFSNPDNFYPAGQPFSKALWSLSITDSSADGLQVVFASNQTSYFRLPAGSSDQTIGDAIANDFQSQNGALVLNGVNIFPAGTTYYVPGEIQYGTGVNAGLTETPEPTTVGLVASAVLLLGVLRAGAKRFRH